MKDKQMRDDKLEQKLRSHFAVEELEVPARLMARLARPGQAQERRWWLSGWERFLTGRFLAVRPLSAALATLVVAVLVGGVSLLVTSPWQGESPRDPSTAITRWNLEDTVREVDGVRMSLWHPLLILRDSMSVGIMAVPAEYQDTGTLGPNHSFRAVAQHRTDGGSWQDAGSADGQVSSQGVGLSWRLPLIPQEATTFEFRITQFGRSDSEHPLDGSWEWEWKLDPDVIRE